MYHFAAYLTLARVEDDDRARIPGDLQVMAIRGRAPAGKPDTGFIFFGPTDLDGFCRILEAIWLDRRILPQPRTERKFFLLRDAVYLQVELGDITKVGESGPIRGAVEGFRNHLSDLLHRLEDAEPVTVDTPLGLREARYLEVTLPDPGQPTDGA